MRTWTASTTINGRPEAVLDVLTDPQACARWAPVPFEVERIDSPRLRTGTKARVSGSLAGRRVGFDIRVHEAQDDRLELTASGPVAFDVAYDLRPGTDSTEVSASVAVSGRGLTGRLLAQATDALLAGGALQHTVSRIAREVETALA
jgi:carbon monoxide dehydrogenase subunit G